MASALDGLTNAAPAANPPAPNNFAAAAKNPAAQRPLAVLKAISTGSLPGVLVPEDAPKIASPLSAQDVLSLGIGFYKPKTPGVTAVLYNAQRVPASTLKALDSQGKLKSALPSITSFLGQETRDKSPDTSDKDSGINNLNLTGSPAPAAPTTVPVLPKPSFSADAQKETALKRMNLISGNVAPSARALPGAGSVLNGLVQQAV